MTDKHKQTYRKHRLRADALKIYEISHSMANSLFKIKKNTIFIFLIDHKISFKKMFFYRYKLEYMLNCQIIAQSHPKSSPPPPPPHSLKCYKIYAFFFRGNESSQTKLPKILKSFGRYNTHK